MTKAAASGMDLNIRDEIGNTPLINAVANGKSCGLFIMWCRRLVLCGGLARLLHLVLLFFW